MINFELPTIGIVGLGYVGEAIKIACDGNYKTICIDVDPNKSTGTYSDLEKAEAVFVCVPSPSKPNGECDSKILESVLYLLKDYHGVIISKTTAPPKVYEKLQSIYPNLVHVPEFLTAANSVRDFSKQQNLIIGGKVLAYMREAERILKPMQDVKTSAFCTIGEAALAKYIINSFLATKVVFMNEMSELAESHGYDWRKIRLLIDSDERIGSSHTKVPGPDGQYGFGGMCFPKDTSALIKYSEKLNVNLTVLKSAIKKNSLLRLKK